MRHKFYSSFGWKKQPVRSPARGEQFPPEKERVLDIEHNEVIMPKELKNKVLKRTLFRAMIMGWKSFAPYS